MPNFVAIAQTVMEICRFFYFSKMAATAILNFLNFKFLSVGRVKSVELCHCVKFHGDRRKMAPAAIWDFSNLPHDESFHQV